MEFYNFCWSEIEAGNKIMRKQQSFDSSTNLKKTAKYGRFFVYTVAFERAR